MKITKKNFFITLLYAFLSVLSGAAIGSVLYGLFIVCTGYNFYDHLEYPLVILQELFSTCFFLWCFSLFIAGLPGVILGMIASFHMRQVNRKIIWYPICAAVTAIICTLLFFFLTEENGGGKLVWNMLTDDLIHGDKLVLVFAIYGACVGFMAFWLEKRYFSKFWQVTGK